MEKTKGRWRWILALILALGISLIPITGYGETNECFTVEYLFSDRYDIWFSARQEGFNREPGTVKLRAVKYAGSNELIKNVTWTSSNTDVAEITTVNGAYAIVTVKTLGKSTIKAVDAEGNTYAFPLYGDRTEFVFIGECMYEISERTKTATLCGLGNTWDGIVPKAISHDGSTYPVTEINISFTDDKERTKVKNITIPKTVTNIELVNGMLPFGFVTGLKAINVEKGNPNYYSVNGVLFDYYKDETGTYKRLYAYPCDKKLTRYRIPEGTQLIYEDVFYDTIPVRELVIPKSLDLTKYNFSGLEIYDKEYNVINLKVKLWINTENKDAINYMEKFFDNRIPWEKWYDDLGGPVELTDGVSAKLSEKYNTVQVKWTGSKISSGTMKYKVEMKKGTDKWTTLTKGTTKNAVKKTKLKAGVKYKFRVTPYAVKGGKTYYGKAKTSDTVYTLKKVSKPKASKASKHYAEIKWSGISGETGYQVYKMKKVNGKYKKVASYKTTKTYKKIKATKGKTYYYKVRAYKKVGAKTIYAPWSKVREYKLK